jgi:hypothetical protein
LRTYPSPEIAADDKFLRQLSSELCQCLADALYDDHEMLMLTMRRLPRGLHAILATHHLAKNTIVGDFGWHFYKVHHRGLCDETQWGLRELEAAEAADLFEAARALVEPHWDEIGRLKAISDEAFDEWYNKSVLERELAPLTMRLWDIHDSLHYFGLKQIWLDYARKYPDRLSASYMEARRATKKRLPARRTKRRPWWKFW